MIIDNVPTPREMVEQYVDDVLSGRVVAGRYVKLACARYRYDQETCRERGLRFDSKIATRCVQFFPAVLRHYKGEWAGEPFHLDAWQAFCVWNLFGWRRESDGLRRFKRAYVTVARKNGKTTIAAGVALLCTYFDEPAEPGAETYFIATKKDQSLIGFHDCVSMIGAAGTLSKRTKIRKSPQSISYVAASSYIKPLSSEANLDGLNPHCVIEDELHAWSERMRDAKEKMESGSGARRQPLILQVTTAGSDDSIIWIEEDKHACNALEAVEARQVYDDETFAFIARIDDEDDPFDESCWVKANPNLGTSVKLSYLRDAASAAKQRPEKLGQFVRYHCNRKHERSDKPITSPRWRRGAQPVEIADGAYCHGGIDLGRTNDWCAAAIVAPRYEDTEQGKVATRYDIVSKAWCCREGGFAADAEPFRGWHRAGLLEICEGTSIDHLAVKEWVIQQSKRLNVATWAYDPQFAKSFGMSLKDEHGINVFEFTQAPAYYHEPCRAFLDALDAGIIHHGDDPVLSWQAKNLVFRTNHKGLQMPDKSDTKHKIDGVVAMLMAFSECMYAAKQESGAMIVY